MNRNLEFVKEGIITFCSSLRKIFKYSSKDREYISNKILLGGGWGYGNTGDEAQCNATLHLLTKRYPACQIVNLTPDVHYSKSQHPEFFHDYAPRVLLFNHTRHCSYYDFDGPVVKKIVFLLKGALLLFNALLVRADLPVFFINARAAKFLYELKECKLFFFGGGGYLTGGTLSRLWEGVLICRLAWLFRTPVVMSGQTIGIWRNNFNKRLARWGFKHVDIITVRDEGASLADLASIGLRGERYFSTHDDALHCDKFPEEQTDITNYVVVNFHYWGMQESEKPVILSKINRIITHILKKGYKIVFVPMHWTDKNCFDDYIAKYPNGNVTCFDYDYDYKKVRRVIAGSVCCVTMKHHPIIFAMGEDVPALSLAFSDYYVHKNVGALAQYGQEKYSCNLEHGNYFEEFEPLFGELLNNQNGIKEVIRKRKAVLDQNKERFMQMVDRYC